MEFYTPISSRIVDSSLWDEDDYVIKIFLTMAVKKDRDHVVRGSAYNIAMWSKKKEEEVIRALEILSSPDSKRLEPQPFEGRRIEKVEDGWLILNGQYYQDMMGIINRRAYKARKQWEYRRKKRVAGDDGKKAGAAYREREKRYVKAFESGDDGKAGEIAAEGL